MQKLSKNYIKKNLPPTSNLVVGRLEELPLKVLQFGEGNFLRGFVDWMINKLNNENIFNGKITIVQPLEFGQVSALNEQDGLYTLLLRGIQNGKLINNKELITAIDRGINIYTEYDKYLNLAQNPDLRIIISNTTEAGISYNPDDKLNDRPQKSFPGKLTAFLYQRYLYFKGNPAKGFIILPCELIDKNGTNLKNIINKYAIDWQLESEFIDWLNEANYFLNTLVDRIVTGYPHDEIDDLITTLGYNDQLIDTGEIFHLWVIEGDKNLAKEFPLDKCNLNVIWTNDLTPYRTRKVRILNGAHTMTSLAAFLCGLDTVKEFIDDELMNSYMQKGIFSEIIPTLELPQNELIDFAKSVIERFSNPYIRHSLLSISLNSVSKFKTRVLPSLIDYINTNQKIPQILSFSLAALIAFYRGTTIVNNSLIGQRDQLPYEIKDDPAVLEFFKTQWTNYETYQESYPENLVVNVLSKEDFWGINLNTIANLKNMVLIHLNDILQLGCKKAIKKLITEY